MTESHGAFTRPLPKEIAASVHRGGPSLKFEDFTKWLNTTQTSTESGDIGRYTMLLAKQGRKKVVRPDTHRKRKLSYANRKKLGLYTLNKKDLTYSQLEPVHQLWKQYMRELLNTSLLVKTGWNNSPSDPQFEQISLKLYRADYHGAHLTVVKSTCPSLVGCCGLLVMETKNCVKLLDKDNITRTIPKKTCQFEMFLDSFKFTFYGNNFIVRSAERSSKKLKLVKPPCL